MRLSYVLLVVATTLLASGSAATASGRSTDVSAMESPELTGMGQAIGSEKRSLRYHNNDDPADEEEDEENDDGEERKGTNIYATEKLNEMLASVKRAQKGDDGVMEKAYKRFSKWEKAGYSPYNPPAAVDKEKYLKFRQTYNSWAYSAPN